MKVQQVLHGLVFANRYADKLPFSIFVQVANDQQNGCLHIRRYRHRLTVLIGPGYGSIKVLTGVRNGRLNHQLKMLIFVRVAWAQAQMTLHLAQGHHRLH